MPRWSWVKGRRQVPAREQVMMVMRIFLVLSAGVLAACSSVPYAQRQAARLAAYTAAAGAPVTSFRFFTLYSWEPLSDSELAVYTQPNQAWLLTVDAGCRELAFTQTIGLTSSLKQVSVRFDKVLTGRRDFPCTIRQIRPLDVKQLHASERVRRQIESQPRTPEPAPAG
jgi:hypothetical protein